MSDFGIQVFNGSGRLILNYDTRVGRFIGVAHPGGAVSGSIYDARLTTGTPFYLVEVGQGYSNVPCYVSFNGGSMSWYYDKAKFPDLSDYGDYTTGVISPYDKIYYGVY